MSNLMKAFLPYEEEGMRVAAKRFVNNQAFADLLAVLRKTGGGKFLYALPGAVQLMPDSWFGGPIMANAAREWAEAFSMEAANVVNAKGEDKVSEEDVRKVAADAQKSVGATPYVLFAGYAHKEHCTTIAAVNSLFAFAPRQQPRQNQKKGEQQQQQPAQTDNVLKTKPFSQVMIERIPLCGNCCVGVPDKPEQKPDAAPAKKHSEHRGSVFDMADRLEDEGLKNAFCQAVVDMPKEEVDALAEVLDTPGELRMWLRCDKSKRAHLYGLMRNTKKGAWDKAQDAQKAFGRELDLFMKQLHKADKALFADMNERLKAEAAGKKPPKGKGRKPIGFFASLFK